MTYTQAFDAENRLISVAVSGQTTTFIYDGDGNLVKKIKPDGSKTLYVGGIYEVDKTSGGSVTRTVTYYPAGGAMRINGTLNYLLGDHLGSTSLTTNASGQVISELRYKAWGEERYASGTTPTKYQYTGQFSYTSDFGLYFYNARWYDPALGRFAQADSIIPQNQGVQAWDRYAYSNNNPVRYNDPTGHGLCEFFQSLFGVSLSCPTDGGDWIEGFNPVHEDIGLEINVPVEEVTNLEGFDPVSQDDWIEGFDRVPEANTLEGFDPVHEDTLQADKIDFGDRSDLRDNLGITDPNVQAHHLIPWNLRNRPLVQLGAQAGWHMNDAYNGMELSGPHAVAGHPNYNDYVDELLDDYYDPAMTAEDADQALMHITAHMRNLIKSNDPRRIR